MIIAKKHVTADRRLILALCDKGLLGKKFSSKDALLDLASDFYKGEETSIVECRRLAKAAYIINAAGNESIKLLKDLGLAGTVIDVQGIPHAQVIIENESE